MDTRKIALTVTLALSLALCLGTGSAQAKGRKPPPAPETLARGDFHDAQTDAISSDGVDLPYPCGELGTDYVDRRDPCHLDPDDALVTVSKVLGDGTYFLRTVSTNLRVPDRWLVLDFSNSSVGDCPGLDTLLADYEGRDPAAVSYVNPDPCVDLLEVRLFVDEVFEASPTETAVSLVIDGPDRVTRRGGREQQTQWNAKFYLDFVNRLTVTPEPAAAGTLTVGAAGDDFRAELWTVNQRNGRRDTLVGIYSMPFLLTIESVP